MKRVVLTGSTGFVGANLARRLLYEGHDVHLLVRPDYQDWRIKDISSSVRIHVVDLHRQDDLIRELDGIAPDWIFHLAVFGAYPHQIDVHAMIDTNIKGVVNLVEACLTVGFETFINTGSSSEYGIKQEAPAENAFLDPNSHYAVTKAFATMFCRYAARSRNVAITTLRLYSVYGPYEEPSRLLPTVIEKGLRGEWPPLVSPAIARDFVYCDDVVEAYLQVASRPAVGLGAVYNVGSGVQTTLADVVAVARRVLGIEAEPVWNSMAPRRWDSTTWVADSSRLRQDYGWQPMYSFEQGFRHMVAWFQRNPDLLERYATHR